MLPRLVKVRRESNSKGVDDVDPEGAGGCKAENLFKLEALDRKASVSLAFAPPLLPFPQLPSCALGTS